MCGCIDRPRNGTEVNSLCDAYKWCDDYLDTVQNDSGHGALMKLADFINTQTMSTAFSGIDAPGSAAHRLASKLQARIAGNGQVCRPPKILSACEWYPESQYELLVHPAHDKETCLFMNISAFYVPELREFTAKVEKEPQLALPLLAPAIKAKRAVRCRGYCMKHKKTCILQSADLHIAGTVCTDWSAFGTRGNTDGKTILHQLAFMALRLLLEEPIVVQENVVQFAPGLLKDFLFSMYFLDVADEDSWNFGVPSHRNRRWIVMRHRCKTLQAISPLSDFMKRFYRICNITWKAFLVADAAELTEELQWAMGRTTVKKEEGITIDTPNAFRMALNPTEAKYLSVYESQWPDRAYSLAQNPESGFGMKSAADGGLHTLLKNVGIIFAGDRWLSPKETLVSQLFPVAPCVKDEHATCSFNLPRSHGSRSREVMKGQAGNSMNNAVAGLVYLYCAIEIDRRGGSGSDAAMIKQLRQSQKARVGQRMVAACEQ